MLVCAKKTWRERHQNANRIMGELHVLNCAFLKCYNVYKDSLIRKRMTIKKKQNNSEAQSTDWWLPAGREGVREGWSESLGLADANYCL